MLQVSFVFEHVAPNLSFNMKNFLHILNEKDITKDITIYARIYRYIYSYFSISFVLEHVVPNYHSVKYYIHI